MSEDVDRIRAGFAERFGADAEGVWAAPGRVNVIIPTPNGRCTNLVLAGEKFDTLYATCNDKVYKRKLATTGANAVLVACSNSLTLPNATGAPQTSPRSWTTSRRLSR